MDNIAKVVFPFALEKEFDYTVPAGFSLKEGMRVLVDFRGKKRVGVVWSFCAESTAAKLKPIFDILDKTPSLTGAHMRFAQALSEMYPYAIGEFLFMMLPPALKNSKRYYEDIPDAEGKLEGVEQPPATHLLNEKKRCIFVKADNFQERYETWKQDIKQALKQGSVIICFPQVSYLTAARNVIEKDFCGRLQILHSHQSGGELFLNWRCSRHNTLILGTRISLFYLPADLKLIILEEENSPYYFQEEKPYYHLLDIAFLLFKIYKIDLILSAQFPSLLTYYRIKQKKIVLIESAQKEKRIRVVNMAERKGPKVVSSLLSELLRKKIEDKKKSVILWNRRGLSQVICCSSCGYVFRCSRCNGFLKRIVEDNKGVCPHCGFSRELPRICDQCNKGYVKSLGLGVEKIEIILKKTFPDAAIQCWEQRTPDSQIIISTSKILSSLYGSEQFHAGFLLDIDSFLSRLDYEATLNSFLYIHKLSHFFNECLYVFTRNPNHYLFGALQGRWKDFYNTELKFRKKISFPPFGILTKIIVRGKTQKTLFKAVQELYNTFAAREIEVYGPFEEYPFRLAGKYRYAIIIKSQKEGTLRKIIKEVINKAKIHHVQTAVIIR